MPPNDVVLFYLGLYAVLDEDISYFSIEYKVLANQHSEFCLQLTTLPANVA